MQRTEREREAAAGSRGGEGGSDGRSGEAWRWERGLGFEVVGGVFRKSALRGVFIKTT